MMWLQHLLTTARSPPQPADASAEMGAQAPPSSTIQSFSTIPGHGPGEGLGGGGGALSREGEWGRWGVDRVRTKECHRAKKSA